MVHPKTLSKFLVKKTNALEICGWKQGKCIEFLDGQLWYEYNYVNDVKHGLCREWYKNGQLAYEYNYVNDVRHGLCCDWYWDRRLAYKHNYVNDVKHGLCRGWYSNGQLAYKHNYVNGKHSLYREWLHGLLH